MTISSVCEYLTTSMVGVQVVVEYSPGDAKTFTLHPKDPPPPGWDTLSLPGQYVLTGAGSDSNGGDDGGDVYETRTYRVQVPVMPLGEGRNARERELRIRPILTEVKQRLRVVSRKARLTSVVRLRVTGDSGPVILNEYDGQFVGFEIQIESLEMLDP